MKPRGTACSAFLLLLIQYLHLTYSSPLKEPNLCGQPLCEPGKKFNYAAGTKYSHRYSVDVATLFRGSSDNKSTLYTDALVDITFLTPCQGLLQITDVTLASERPQYNKEEDEDIKSPPLPKADEFSNAISRKSLRFSWQDGAISELCPDPADPVWVVNFKRGVLSAFHNTMQRFDIDSSDVESDVNGDCMTNYQLQEARSTALVIHKEKVISTCRNRYKYRAMIQTDPYDSGSSFQAVPLVKSRHLCEFSIDRKIYNTIECEEVHTFHPLSQAENGSQTITRQRIQFLQEIVTNVTLPDEPLVRRVNLLFDHNATEKPISGEMKASRDLIRELCKLDNDNVDIGYPDAFRKLVVVGRKLNLAALSQIYNRGDSLCSSGKKQITDLLPTLETNAAVGVMVENIAKVPKDTAQVWLVSMAFIRTPNEETLRMLLKLLNLADSQAILSLTSLAHTFCKINSNCIATEPIKEIVAYLDKQLNGCQERLLTVEQRDEILIALKGVGNLGVSTPELLTSLRYCVLSDARDMELRTAAVTAHRRLACEPVRDLFLDVYRNATFETELRVASYLQVMRCPNYHIISLIRQQLDQEEVNQVGSFVWSHLQNQLTSSMPTKVLVQTLLTDRLLNDKFNKDHRKFSRSYESSMFFDEFNAGGNIESQVIFSPKSYLPRTVMANVTLDLFGESVNVVEVEARLEGLEHMIEAVFGPGGPLSATKVNSQVDRVMRLFRSVTDRISEQLNEIPNVIDNNFKVPKVSLGYKIFGNEVFYSSVTGHQEFWKVIDKFNPAKRLKQLLSGQEMVVNKAAMFMDADYFVPTGVGMPVVLAVQGTSAMNFNVVGNVRNLDLLSLDIDGKLKPSIAVEVTGEMGLDAYHASTGVKLKASLYTSTAVEGHLLVEGKTKATLSFNLPKEKGEVITARTNLIVVKGEVEEEQIGITEHRVSTTMCTWPSLNHTLGLKTCMDAAFPNASNYMPDKSPLLFLLGPPKGNLTNLTPNFLLSGPSLLAIGIHKADPTAEKYVLKYLWDQQDKVTAVSLVFDTPGSKQHRELSARLLLDNVSKNLTLLLQSVDNKFEAHGSYRFEANDKYFGFTLDINGKTQVLAQIGLRKTETKRGALYQPKLLIAINGDRLIELLGSVSSTEKKGILQYDIKLDLLTRNLTLNVTGNIQQGQASWYTKMTFDYRFTDKPRQRLMVELRVGNTSSKSLTQYNGDLTVQSTAYSYLNFKASLKYQRAQGHADAKLIVNTRPDLKDDRHKFTAHFSFSIHKTFERTSYNVFISATKPVSNIDLRLGLSFNALQDKSTTYLNIRYATGKEVDISLVLAMPRSDLLKFDGRLNVTLPGFVPMIIGLKLDEEKISEYNIALDATWFSGHNMTAAGVYADKSEGLSKSYSLKMFVQSPSFHDITVIAKFISDVDQFKLDLQAEHQEEKYALVLKEATYGKGEMEAYGELRYKSSLYHINTLINLNKAQQVTIEVHLDKYRDVHIIMSRENLKHLKVMGIEVKWDANRDPGQRFAGQVRFLHPMPLVYSVDASAVYPGRKVVGLAEFSVRGAKFDSGLRLEWSPTDVFDVRAGAIYNTGNETDFRVTSQLLTPFVGWKRTSLGAGFLSRGNFMQANGTVWWQDDQMVGANLYWDYDIPESQDLVALRAELSEDDDDNVVLEKLLHIYFPDLWCAFNASLLSTVSEVKPMHAAFSHRQQRNGMDTQIHWQGKEVSPLFVRSRWQVDGSDVGTHVVGNVTMTSPYKGYQRGVLLGRLYYTSHFDIDGIAELDLDRKEYYATIKGHVTSLRNNMLVFNVTTPIPQMSAVTGRLGYLESDHHLVCMWTMPNSTLGAEVFLNYVDSNDFDLLLHLATPLDFFSKLLLLGKRHPHMVELRAAFNQILVGIVGSWRYAGLTDLNYEYTLYTPLQGFNETTLVAKILMKDGVDFDLRMRVAGVKVGATVLWVQKPAGLRRALVKLQPAGSEEHSDKKEMRWRGSCRIDTHIYRTITCDISLDRIHHNTVIEANAVIPMGNVYLYDEFYFKDAFNIKNDLQLSTPFKSCPEITSVANFHMIPVTDVLLEFELHVRAANVTKKGGLLLRYKMEGQSEDDYYDDEPGEPVPIQHAATLQCHTPWDALPLLRMSTLINHLEYTTTSNLTIATNQTWFTVEATTVSDSAYQKIKAVTMMISPEYKIPPITIEGKRDATASENVVEFSVKCPHLALSYSAKGKYSFIPQQQLSVDCTVDTTWPPLEHAMFLLSIANNSEGMSIRSKLHHRPDLVLEVNGEKKGSALTLTAERLKVAALVFDGTLTDKEDGKNALIGSLLLKKHNEAKNKWDIMEYNVDTEVVVEPQRPLAVKMTLAPKVEGGRSVFIEVLALRSEADAKFNLSLNVGRESLSLTAGVDFDANQVSAVNTDVRSSLSVMKDIHTSVSLARNADTSWDLGVDASSPHKGARKISVKGNYWKDKSGKKLSGAINTDDVMGQLRCEYAWLLQENMAGLLSGSYQRVDDEERHVHTEIFYRHPGQNLKLISLGMDFDIDKFYRFGTNATLSLPTEGDVAINMHLKLPRPGDIHSVVGKMLYTPGYSYVAHTVRYSSIDGHAVTGSSGEVNVNKTEVGGNIKLEWGALPDIRAVTNVLLYKKPNSSHMDVQYTLHTPYYPDDTVVARVTGNCPVDVWDIKAHLHHPRSRPLTSAAVSYQAINNINGTVQSKTPFAKIPQVGFDFEIISRNSGHFRRHLTMTWPNNSAVVKSDYWDVYTISSEGRVRDLNGEILVEIPLASRLVTNATYKYQDAYPKSMGEANINYNGSQILAKYGCVSESKAGYTKDDMDVSLDNTLIFPIGAHYIHEVHYDGTNEDNDDMLSMDRKWLDLFRLGNRTAFNVIGDLQVKTLDDGKEIKVTAKQANTTVNLDTDYHFLDHRFTHSSKVTLMPGAWASYYLDIINRTTETQEEGEVRLDIAYPRKNFTVSGHIRQDTMAHESDVKLEWNRPENPRSIGAGFDWYRASRKPDQQVATLRLKHPSFVKDVTFNSTYIRHGTKSIVGRFELEYSNVTDKKLMLEATAKDLSVVTQSLYMLEVMATHPATRLDLAARGTVSVQPGEYEGRGDARYKRSFLGQQNGLLLARVDGIKKAINFEKHLQHEESYLKARLYNDEGCCIRLNGSLAKTQSLNYSGDFFLDLDEKLLLAVVNMTEEGNENLRAHGYIPDTRFAELNVWRTYDDLTVSDIACYLKLNHSRLVTSRLKWRPTLRKEVLQLIEDAYLAVLKNVDDTVDYWKDYTRSEVKEAVADIFYNSKPDVAQFLDDLEDLKTLEQDLEDFRTLLNDSYNANAFYVKDVASTVLLLVDELSLKKHIGSVPVVLRELWKALGDSGESIRRSLAWIIETVKTSYRKAVELVHQLLHGDSGAKISSLLEEWIVRYDKTVKELQMTVLRHIEQLYTSITDSISETWTNLLRAIEPTYIQIVHYLEDAAYDLSHEVFNFLYERESELRESPFFLQIANFTQDLDRFHKDLLERDIFTNVHDYSTRFYAMARDKFLPKIPFGKEIHRVVTEIIEGFQDLEKLPSINYLVKKRDEAVQRFVWFWQSLDLGTKLQRIATIVQRRLLDVSASALQSENKYREAKTKFIFEPTQGLVLLEQKLPMSWHAFNETPRFEEIPEYRAVVVFQNQLTFSNKTFWAFYYEYKPYTEIQNWLPPFKGQAMVAGSQHLVTFDGRFLSFKGDCDYLLARDFVNGNFSLVMRHLSNQTKPDQFMLSLITPLHTVTIDIFNNEIYLPQGTSLPAQLGHVEVYKEHGVVTVEERDGYILQCNMLYQVCTLSLSGWYYGKTAGLLGTMDHEVTSDLLTSHGHVTEDVTVFARSWVVNRAQCAGFANKANIPLDPPQDLTQACTALFHSKSSHFSSCFGLVNPAAYLKMCTVSHKEMCSAAAAYVLACQTQYTLLTIPDSCVSCAVADGKTYSEGTFIKLTGKLVPRSVDVVFIVEAKECNRNMTSKRNIGIFLNVLAKKLDDVGLKNNRYATVVFGGDGVFNSPRALLPDHPAESTTETFTTVTHALKSFQRFQVGNGTEDIFTAIAYASTLQFRPGISKIFIALPCSSCDPSLLSMEYSTLRQILLEENIRLHLLMNDDFIYKKKRLANMFYGIDNAFAFTKKDRDKDLRQQATLPKSMVAYCAPLALETNGTVFTSKWLAGENTHPVNKFAGVVGRRVAASAEPADCQTCECSSFETGLGYMKCQPCAFPTATKPHLGVDDYTDSEEDVADADDYTEVDEES